MEPREIVGYLLALIALAIAAGGVWAAFHYSPGRSYARMRRRERRAARERVE